MTTASDKPTDRYPDSEGPFAGPNNTFPVGTAARVRNAWSRIHQRAVIANHTPAEVASIKAKIRARAKELGITLEEHDDSAPTDDDSTSALERSYYPGLVECRSGQRRIGGLAAVFGRRSRLLHSQMGTFYEELDNQFFTESRSGGWDDVIARAEHSPALLLGAVRSGTLQLAVDHRGLDYQCDLSPARQDIYEAVGRGDYGGSSFTFICLADSWGWVGGTALRTLQAGQLLDVGPVCNPAYRDTSAALRSLARHAQAPLADVEKCWRDGELRRLLTRTDIDGGAPASTLEYMARAEARRQPAYPRGATKPLYAIQHENMQRLLGLRARRNRW
jgi:uncharacterized protein